MNWFRKHLKHGSRLALVALAVQFALSFGHFHALAALPAPAAQAANTDFAFAADPAARALGQKQLPSAPDTDQQPADHCAICAVMSLAGSALLAAPPWLQLPQAVGFRYLTADAEFIHLGPVDLAFRSRAPPAS
jgi:hypothetical protein